MQMATMGLELQAFIKKIKFHRDSILWQDSFSTILNTDTVDFLLLIYCKYSVYSIIWWCHNFFCQSYTGKNVINILWLLLKSRDIAHISNFWCQNIYVTSNLIASYNILICREVTPIILFSVFYCCSEHWKG